MIEIGSNLLVAISIVSIWGGIVAIAWISNRKR